MAAGERAPVVGTHTLIATPTARPPWAAGADARLVVWPPDPVAEPQPDRYPGPHPGPHPAPAVIARVAGMEALKGASGCGVATLWAEPSVKPAEAVATLALTLAASPTNQLVLEVDDRCADGDLPAEMIGLAQLAAASEVPPSRLVLALWATPRINLAAALDAWRAAGRLRRHPLVVIVPAGTTLAVGSGLVTAAAMADASVATDDVRGARRVLEVVSAIRQRTATHDEAGLT